MHGKGGTQHNWVFLKIRNNFVVAKVGQRKWHSTFIAQDERQKKIGVVDIMAATSGHTFSERATYTMK